MVSKINDNYLKKELYELIKADESIFDFIQDSSLDGLWYWDIEQPENEWMNAKFWTVLGYNPEEMPHKSSAWQDIINQDDLKTALENFTKHCENPDHPYDQIVRYTHKNGSTVWIRCRGLAIRDKNGKAKRMLGAHHDITDVKQAEIILQEKNEEIAVQNEEIATQNEELNQANQQLFAAKEKAEENEKKYRFLIENITDVVWILDLDEQKYTYLSPTVYNLRGYTVEEIMQQPMKNSLTPNSAKKVEESIKLRLPRFLEKPDEHQVYHDEIEQPHKNGSIIITETSTFYRKNEQNGHIEVIGVSRDISERKKAEQALKESEAKYSVLFTSMSEMVVLHELVYNEDGKPANYRIIDCNDAFTKITGISRNASVGELSTKVYGTQEPPYLSKYSEVVLTGQPYHYETYFQPMDKHFSISAIKLRNNRFATVTTDITERKQIEYELKENVALLSMVTETSPVGIVTVDKTGNITYANKRAEEILGLVKEEITSRSYDAPLWKHTDIDGSPLPDEKQPFNIVKTTMNTAYNVQHGITWPDGTVVLLSINASPMKDIHNNFNGMVATLEDITNQKQAEQALKESAKKIKNKNTEIELSNERLESLLRVSQLSTNSIQELLDFALHEAIKLTGSKIGYIYFYDEEKQQFILNSWSKDVMKECTVVEPRTVYDLDKVGIWGEAVRQKKPILLNDYQAKNPLKKGTPKGHVPLKKFLTIPVILDDKIVSVTGVANKEKDYNDADIRQLTLLMDSVWKISERLLLIEDLKIAKEKAEESEKYLKQAQQSAQLGNWKLDIVNNSLHWSDEIYRIFDCQPQEFKATYEAFLEFIHPDDRGPVNEAYTRSLQTQKPYDITHRLLLKNGKIKYVQEKCNTTFDDDGKPLISEGIVLDITKLKEQENKLHKYSRKLEEANATKDQFISILGHDLRNPFTTLLGFSDILIKKFDQYDREKIKEHVETIYKTSRQTFNLLNNLLEWSRCQRDKVPFKPETTNLYVLVYETYMLLNNSADAKQINIELDVAEEINTIADSEMIKTVIRNLLSNAIKFTPESGTINISARQNQKNIQVEISDTGTGMNQETLSSLFKIGKTQSRPGTKGERGTGFGLLLCKEFIEKHGGKIWAESEIGKGSNFKFTLPV